MTYQNPIKLEAPELFWKQMKKKWDMADHIPNLEGRLKKFGELFMQILAYQQARQLDK